MLAEAINTYHTNPISAVTVTSALGSFAVAPAAMLYLNKCTYNAGVYTVGSSVFRKFDPNNAGIMLSTMIGLDSITGYESALIQCGSWAHSQSPLYASTTHSAGTSGTADATGCSSLSTAGDALALCFSVFDTY